jgi:hypothetical protein
MSHYPPVVEAAGSHPDSESHNGTMLDFIVKAGSVVHVCGIPVALTADTRVSTAGDLVAHVADKSAPWHGGPPVPAGSPS